MSTTFLRYFNFFTSLIENLLTLLYNIDERNKKKVGETLCQIRLASGYKRH
nr:MAG TPA: hypothetical protein [Caudoviricetes sp.]